MTEHPSPVDRLEARLDAQDARIDELYRMLQAAPDRRRNAEPRRRPRRRRDRIATRP